MMELKHNINNAPICLLVVDLENNIYIAGVGVMMLLVLTIERYVSVCHPSFTRPVMGPPG